MGIILVNHGEPLKYFENSQLFFSFCTRGPKRFFSDGMKSLRFLREKLALRWCVSVLKRTKQQLFLGAENFQFIVNLSPCNEQITFMVKTQQTMFEQHPDSAEPDTLTKSKVRTP